MGRSNKTLTKMKANPRDWRIESLDSVARAFGLLVRRGAGSHVVYGHCDSPVIVTVPAHKPIKPLYVRQFVALIESIKGANDV